MRGQYILNDEGEPVPADDLMEWGRWFQTANRTVAADMVGVVRVSTVFLGLDHQFGDGPPLVFETMVFGGKLDGEQDRYSTRAEALAGHAATLKQVIAAEGAAH